MFAILYSIDIHLLKKKPESSGEGASGHPRAHAYVYTYHVLSQLLIDVASIFCKLLFTIT
jgi:hypothetical protein